MRELKLPGQIDENEKASVLLETTWGAACVKVGFAISLQDATENNPTAPKVGFVSKPQSYAEFGGERKTFKIDEKYYP